MPVRAPYNMLMRAMPLDGLDPRRVALLVLDAQHCTTSRGGGFFREAQARGIAREFDEYFAMGEAALGNIALLLDACRVRSATIVHSVLTAGPGLSRAFALSELPLPVVTTRPADEIRPEVAPAADELVFARGVYSPFYGSALERHLRDRSIGTVIIAGMLANITLALAAREAVDRGFDVLLVQDATASETIEWHGLTMQGIGGPGIRVQWTHEIVEMLEGNRR